jgi:hypothetical protein
VLKARQVSVTRTELNCCVAAPEFPFQPPALLEFTVGVVLDVPTRSICLKAGFGGGPGARADQRPRFVVGFGRIDGP